MEPVQQFCEVKGKFPKFVPSTTIPISGTKNLKTLELQQVCVYIYKINLMFLFCINFNNYFRNSKIKLLKVIKSKG